MAEDMGRSRISNGWGYIVGRGHHPGERVQIYQVGAKIYHEGADAHITRCEQ